MGAGTVRGISPLDYKPDFLGVAYGDIQGVKSLLNSFFAPKLAHRWAQTVGARAE